ncbi:MULTISPECIES: MBG domain-containing protein [Bacteroides]|uniref:MBG domain-containing protein n=1 Tax=Bacteroides TaxID=816 RepID=UPI00259CA1D2|nr:MULTISPECIES: MBG domain-containing protein [Bacteroides]
MKKFITLMMCVVLYAGSALAQQIKGDFEEWEDCYPAEGKLVGKQPVGWTASNVYQIIVGKEFVFPDAGRTGTGAKIMNDYVGMLGIGANAPAFVTLGKMWVFADMSGMLGGNDMSNGGVNGGIDFTYRPDSLTVYYKRKLGTEKPNETAKVLVYLWKGTFKSKIINSHSGNDVTYVEVDDQDRAILGKEIIPAETKGDGVLIASTEYTITKETEGDGWVRLSIPVNYVEGENGKLVPEKMNIVFSGGNYWVRADIGKENTLWVDDAALVYNAKLSSVTLGGEELTGFDPDKFEYNLAYNEHNKAIVAKAFGKDAVVTEATTKEDANEVIKTLTVTCADNATSDVNKTYVYTLTFKGSYVGDITAPADMSQVYGDGFEIPFTSTNTEVPFTYTIGSDKVLKYDSETKKFYAIGAGTTTVVAHQEKEGALPAVSDPVTVTIEKASLTMTLKAWCQRGKTISFNTSSSVAANGTDYGVEFEYEGLKNDDGEGTIVDVVHKIFDTKNIYISSGAAGKEATDEVIGNYRPIVFSFTGSSDPLTTVSTNNYNVTFVNNGAEIRKTFLTVYPYYDLDGTKVNLNKNDAQGLFVYGSDIDYRITYSGFVYKEDAAVMEALGNDTVNVVFDKAPKTAAVGEVVPLTVKFPQKVLDNYEFKTYTGLTVKALKAYTVENAEKIEKVYGDAPFEAPFIVKNDKGESVDYTITPSSTSRLTVSGKTLTIKSAYASTYVTIKVAANDEYMALSKRVDIPIAKAPLTVTAQNVALLIGSPAPETFELIYDGFVYDEDVAKAFGTKVPVAALEKEIPSDAKVGDEFAIAITKGTAANYEVTYVNGVLKITAPTGIDNNSLSDVRVYSENGAICVANNEATETIEVYTTQGVKVYEGTDNVISTNIDKDVMYVVRVGSYVAKIVVR